VKYKLFKLKFRSPLHIGTNKPGFESSDEVLHSDTLFSALINCWLQLYPGDIPLFFPDEDAESIMFPFFRISSAFPYYDGSLYFPKPFIRMNLPKQLFVDNPKMSKKLKKIMFLEQTLFEKIINCEEVTLSDDMIFSNGQFADANLIHKGASDIYPFIKYDVPRIVKDRMTGETTPFHFTRIQFNDNAGLFFLADFQDKEWEHKFIAVLRLLGDTGVGGDRSVGHGQFSVDSIGETEIRTPENPTHFLSLSLFHPKTEEVEDIISDSSYQLTERKGWIFSGAAKPLRRQTVRMFQEGSIFKGPVKEYGDTVRVLKRNSSLNLHHDVYRYGQPIIVSVLKKGGDDE